MGLPAGPLLTSDFLAFLKSVIPGLMVQIPGRSQNGLGDTWLIKPQAWWQDGVKPASVYCLRMEWWIKADGSLLAGSQSTFSQRLTNQTRGVKQSQYIVKGQRSRLGSASCLFESAVRQHSWITEQTCPGCKMSLTQAKMRCKTINFLNNNSINTQNSHKTTNKCKKQENLRHVLWVIPLALKVKHFWVFLKHKEVWKPQSYPSDRKNEMMDTMSFLRRVLGLFLRDQVRSATKEMKVCFVSASK